MTHDVERILLTVVAINLGLVKGIQLTQLTTCTCLGHEVIYECILSGSGATTWNGTALEECDGGRLLLRHSEFNSDFSINSTCGSSGHISSYAVSVENGTYISQLVLNVNNDTVNDTIECSGGSEEGVDNALISLSTTSPPPPTNVRLSSIDNGHFVYTWDSADISCPATSYLINASGCGECPNITHTVNVSCLIPLSEQPQECSLSVQTVLCEDRFGNRSMANHFRIRGFSQNGVKLLTVDESDSEEQRLFLVINTNNALDFAMEMTEDAGQNSSSVVLNVTIHSGNPSELCCSTTIHVDVSCYEQCSQTYEIPSDSCPCLNDTSSTLSVMVSVIGSNTTLVMKEIPTDNPDIGTRRTVTSTTTDAGGHNMQDFTTIIGVGSAFVFVAIVLVLGIVLASTVVFIKVRSNRRTKPHDFIVQENTDSSPSRDTQDTSQLQTDDTQKDCHNSGHHQVIVNIDSESIQENKEVVYAEIGPSLKATKISSCLDHDRVAYSEIRLSPPDAQEDEAYDYGY